MMETPLDTLKRKSEALHLLTELTKPNKTVTDVTDDEPAAKKEKKYVMTGLNMARSHSERDQKAKTPIDLFVQLNDEFCFNFDPCPANVKWNGLEVDWGTRNYVNPPYKFCLRWLRKAHQEAEKGKLSVFLLPSRTNTRWFHDQILDKENVEVRYLKGKLVFQGYKKGAPFASILVIIKPVTSQQTL